MERFRPVLRAGNARFSREAAQRPILRLRGRLQVVPAGRARPPRDEPRHRARRVRLRHGAERLGQVDAAAPALPRRDGRRRPHPLPRPRRRAPARRRRSRSCGATSASSSRTSSSSRRGARYENVAVALEVLGLPQRLDPRAGRRGARARRARGPRRRPGRRALGRRAAARRHRARHRRRAGAHPRRRADRQPRPPARDRHPRASSRRSTRAARPSLFATHDRTLLEVRPRRVVVLDEGKAIDVPHGIATDEYDNRLPL